MPTPALTPQNAPRDLEQLKLESPFQLRCLLLKLGCLTNEEEKMTWHNMQTPENRASHVLGILQAYDRATGTPGGATQTVTAPPGYNTAGGAQQVAPVMMPQQMAPQVPLVSQAAVSAATAATAEKPKRSPRTSAASGTETPSAPADLGAEVINLLNRVLDSNNKLEEKYDAFAKKIVGTIEEAASSKTSRVTALENKHAELAAQLTQVLAYQQSAQQMQTWTLMAFLTFMQESMGASIPALLGAAISDSAQFQQLLNKATGKA